MLIITRSRVSLLLCISEGVRDIVHVSMHMHISSVHAHVSICCRRIYRFVVLRQRIALPAGRQYPGIMFWPDLNTGAVCVSQSWCWDWAIDTTNRSMRSTPGRQIFSPVIYSSFQSCGSQLLENHAHVAHQEILTPLAQQHSGKRLISSLSPQQKLVKG